MATTEEPVGRAATRRGRQRLALQKVVKDTGCNPDDLTYVEDKRSGTSNVVDKTGAIKGRFSW
ncbi:hypothetical protein DMB42_11410 [Nonomuraea sp. WAC 01424]|uniref:hypothetical protein n=1 Tax=Nonomuraea sp. WAC 01424 TaxID=2203200 RepID=UPI000F79EBA4|nr:hypothetical protein [Nonomuraea sp. WAC 01424]RSN12778.1 hypothetical protein DMB42_11410 [Nonomuraea sp. WAC 01424]